MRRTPIGIAGLRGGPALAVCHHPGCRWRNFVYVLTPATGCRRHPGECGTVPDGTTLSVRCFGYPPCRQDSVKVAYRRGRHTREDLRCPEHSSTSSSGRSGSGGSSSSTDADPGRGA